MAPRSGSADDSFLPFNFSSILPFDSLAAALAELPTPQIHQPLTADDAFLDDELNCAHFDGSMEDEVLQILLKTAQDGQWELGQGDKASSAISCFSNNGTASYEGQIYTRFLNELQRLRELRPSLSKSELKTPKRPRRVIPVESDSEQGSQEEPRTMGHTMSEGLSTVGDTRLVSKESSSFDMDEDTHLKEIRLQQESKIVESDELRSFFSFLRKFTNKADRLATQLSNRHKANLQVSSTASYMTELQETMNLHLGQGAIALTPPSLLDQVASIMDSRIIEFSKEHSFAFGPTEKAVVVLPGIRLGLVASSIVLTMLSSPGSPRSLFVEERLDNIAGLLEHVSTALLYPSFDEHYRTSKARVAHDTGSIQKGHKRSQTSDDTARPKSVTAQCIVSRKAARGILDLCCALYDALTALLLREPHLPESFASRIARVCIESFSVNDVSRLHIHAMRALCAIFASDNDTARRLWILDTILSDVAGKVPNNRRHLRCFQISDTMSDVREVRVSSALIAQLLCLASTENGNGGDINCEHDERKDGVSLQWSTQRRKQHDRSAQYSARVWESFFKRTFEKDSETRAAFQALLEDTIVLYGRPEWPSAELMLQTLSVSLISRMRADKEKSALLRAFSIEVLGALATRMCDLYGDEIIQMQEMSTPQLSSPALEQEREKLLLFLDPNRSLLFKAASGFYEAMFLSDDYSLGLTLIEKPIRDASQTTRQNAARSTEEESRKDATDISNITATLEATALSRGRNAERRRSQRELVSAEEARQAAKYVSANRSFARGFRTVLGAVLDGMQDPAPTVRAKSIKALAKVDEACGGVLRLLPEVLVSIEASCKDVSTLARDAALDLLSRALLRNTAACSNGRIGDDESLSQKPAIDNIIPERVFGIVRDRLRDTSTSVRKRAVTIMRAVMLAALEHSKTSVVERRHSVEASGEIEQLESRIIEICVSLVPRLDDSEGSVREASERTLRLGLFGFDVTREAKGEAAQDPTAVAQVLQRLQAVLTNYSSKYHHSIMSRVFQANILNNQKPFLAAIVNASVYRLRDYEDILADLTRGQKLVEIADSARQKARIISAKKQACCSVLRAFSELDPRLLRAHCKSLAPSIKGMLDGGISQLDLACVECILHILENGIGTDGDWDVDFLQEVMGDIEHIVCTSPVQGVEEAAVRCLCVVSMKSGTAEASELLERTARNFMGFLEAEKEAIQDCCQSAEIKRNTAFGGSGEATRLSALEKNARCALVRLGLLLRYGDFEEAFVSEAYETLEMICRAVCVACPIHVLAWSSIRAVTHILIRHRYLLTQGTRVLLFAMGVANRSDSRLPSNRDTADGIPLCVLEGFRELLRDEEERNSKEKESKAGNPDGIQQTANVGSDARIVSHRQGCTTKRQPLPSGTSPQPELAAEEDAEAGYLALSAQALMPQLEKAVFWPARQVRQVIAHILGLLVRQGLVLPANVIPSLFCLLLDEEASCREYSHRVVSFLADRHSDMLASAALPGLRSCFESSFAVRYSTGCTPAGQVRTSQSLFTPEKITDMSIDEKSGHSLLSQAIMAMRRDQRRGVLESLIREFDPRVAIRNQNVLRKESDYVREDPAGQLMKPGDTGVRSNEMVAPDDDADEDVMPSIYGKIDIVTSGRVCSLPTLYFFAVTLATLDYTDGAGIGGSLTQGGGTAAAETKLKYAKEDVSHLVSIATRIISNSGQATLQVAQHLMKSDGEKGGDMPREQKMKIVGCASRISLLLMLKRHLKLTRWEAVLDGEESDVAGQVPCRMPAFCPDGSGLAVCLNESWWEDVNGKNQGNEVLMLFSNLMREDSIDEEDVAFSSRMVRGGRGGGKRSTTGKKAGKRLRRKQGSEVMSDVRRERSGRQAAQEAAKKLRFDLSDSE